MEQRTLVILFIGLAAVVGVAWWQLQRDNAALMTQPPAPTAVTNTLSPSQVQILPSDPSRGSAAAAVTVVEFSDFQCPYCAQLAPELAQVMANHPTDVRLVWKDLPLPQHDQAASAAEAAQCAGLQGKFWNYHDGLFQQQSSLGPALYQQLAVQLGLASSSFSLCLSQHQTLPLIQRNAAMAAAAGVDGTPYLIMNGQAYNGALTADALEQAIQQAKAASHQPG